MPISLNKKSGFVLRCACCAVAVISLASFAVTAQAEEHGGGHGGDHGRGGGYHGGGRGHGGHGYGGWNGGYWGAPPVVYGSPAYCSPPVIYGPGVAVALPGAAFCR